MALKYKLKEAPAPNLAKKGGYKIGDVSYSKDGDTKFVVNSIDDETGQVGWKVVDLPAFDKLNDDVDELVSTAKGVYTKTKSDEEFRKIYEEARLLRNRIRKHLRNEYPDEYKRMTMEEEIESSETNLTNTVKLKYNNAIASSSDFADAILDIWNELSAKENDAITKTNVLKQAKALLAKQSSQENVDEISTTGGGAGSATFSAGTGMQYATPYAFKKKKKKLKKEGVGATLGPGPKATEDGVKDNAYVKQFKFKLVPKNKNGTYVQKGSGLEVNKLF